MDKRIAVAKFKTWIGKRMGMEPMQFVLLKHHEVGLVLTLCAYLRERTLDEKISEFFLELCSI